MMKVKDLANKVIGDSLHRARKKGSFHLPPKSLPIDKLKPYTTFTRRRLLHTHDIELEVEFRYCIRTIIGLEEIMEEGETREMRARYQLLENLVDELKEILCYDDKD